MAVSAAWLVACAAAPASFAADEDQDIIRILPPGPTTPGSPQSPSQTPGQGPGGQLPPDQQALPFPPSGIGKPAPLKLDGETIKLAMKVGASSADPSKGYAGVRMDIITGDDLAKALGVSRQPAVYIIDASPGGPAAEAGLRFGDVILEVGGTAVASTEQLATSVRNMSPGTSTDLTVYRVGRDGAAYLEALRDLANRGSTPVMIFISRLYALGIGVRRDLAEAVSWYRKAADAGSTNGMLLLGDALATGSGTIKDLTEARKWIKQAADAGNAAAFWRLGCMLRDGEGMDKDPLEAISLFKKAAEASYTPAMVAIGFMFEGGGGIEADHLQAVYWYKRAADSGDAEGMAVLGSKYYAGRGVEKNYATAANWYTQAAKRGQLLATHNLAVMYDKGLGVGKDAKLAADFIYRALEARYAFTHQQMMQSSRSWTRDFRKALQQKLIEQGRLSGTPDGNFNKATLEAIDALAKPIG